MGEVENARAQVSSLTLQVASLEKVGPEAGPSASETGPSTENGSNALEKLRGGAEEKREEVRAAGEAAAALAARYI